MDKAITDYQKWKEQGEQLRSQARQAMESRFGELLTEAVALAREYQIDFGQALKPPSAVTAFRYKAIAKSPVKKKNSIGCRGERAQSKGRCASKTVGADPKETRGRKGSGQTHAEPRGPRL